MCRRDALQGSVQSAGPVDPPDLVRDDATNRVSVSC